MLISDDYLLGHALWILVALATLFGGSIHLLGKLPSIGHYFQDPKGLTSSQIKKLPRSNFHFPLKTVSLVLGLCYLIVPVYIFIALLAGGTKTVVITDTPSGIELSEQGYFYFYGNTDALGLANILGGAVFLEYRDSIGFFDDAIEENEAAIINLSDRPIYLTKMGYGRNANPFEDLFAIEAGGAVAYVNSGAYRVGCETTIPEEIDFPASVNSRYHFLLRITEEPNSACPPNFVGMNFRPFER